MHHHSRDCFNSRPRYSRSISRRRRDFSVVLDLDHMLISATVDRPYCCADFEFEIEDWGECRN
jgi:hypothetical protein